VVLEITVNGTFDISAGDSSFCQPTVRNVETAISLLDLFIHKTKVTSVASKSRQKRVREGAGGIDG
jgi:hypothetical protein